MSTDEQSTPCNPPLACETHGRCWAHSEWARCACGEIVDGLDGKCDRCRVQEQAS